MSTKKILSELPFSSLTAISPLDGRYHNRLTELSPFVSEFGLIKTRIEIEVKYLIALSENGIIRDFSVKEKKSLHTYITEFTLEDAEKVKELETQTRHDVKAMERTLRKILQNTTLKDITEMIHIGLTSEDINNLSYRLMLYRGTQNVIVPALEKILGEITLLASEYKNLPMLARTHGQAAVPTTLGKELIVFATRLDQQLESLRSLKLTGKLNGAVGNFNALQLTYPLVNWIKFSTKFVTSLGLTPNLITTQINSYDDTSEYFQNLERINNILISFDQDVWRYISDNWFVQVAKKGEVGSSTMPQKVNPIDFENSEGNLGLANSLLEYMARKLAISRLQRDLTDSTTIRNLSTVLGYCLLGYKSISTGLSRIKPNPEEITAALHNDWVILTEGVQTILRSAGVHDPYSLIASLSRGKHIGPQEWTEWITSLPIDGTYKKKLANLTPETYIGLAVELTEKAIKDIQKK